MPDCPIPPGPWARPSPGPPRGYGCVRSGWSLDDDTRQVIEAGSVGRDDDPAGGDGSGGDDEVMRATRSACLSHRHEKLGVRSSDVETVVDDRQGVDDVVEERLSRLSAFASRDLDAHAEFSDRDRSDGGFVVVSDQCVQVEDRSFGVDEDVGVEQEQRQNRSCTVRSSRSALTSSLQARSIR